MATTLNFGKLFGKSPFKPVKKHMKIATECAQLIGVAVDAFLAADKEKLKEIKQEITHKEDQADEILEELQSRLPKTMFLPVHRHDLIDVLEMQEAIVDRTEDIIGLMLDLPIDVPAEMHPVLRTLADRCHTAVEGAYEIVASFEALVETGFKGPHLEKTQKTIRDVIRMETDADTYSLEITHSLFAHCKEMDPVSVVFLYKLIGWIDDLADYSERLAVKSRLLLAR